MGPQDLKIGYIPYSQDLSHPDDRRRFPYFARRNNIPFEIADSASSYDVLLIPAPANLSKWLRYKKDHPNTVYIFEMVDSLIHQKDWVNLLFKGAGRFLLGKENYLHIIHRNLLIKWLKCADFVICSSPVTLDIISKWNPNTLFNLDYQEEEYHFLKKDYAIKNKMKLFWEGQGVVLHQLLFYKDLFEEINSFCELHIVTSESFPRFGQFFKQDTISFLKKFPIDSFFHVWDQKKNPGLFSTFDCGIIPLNPNDIYPWNKPANKLISFWFSGIPTLTSDTPAYHEVGEKTNPDFLCENKGDWIRKIKWIKDMNAAQRKEMAIRNYNFAKQLYADEILDKFWFSLLGRTTKTYERKTC